MAFFSAKSAGSPTGSDKFVIFWLKHSYTAAFCKLKCYSKTVNSFLNTAYLHTAVPAVTARFVGLPNTTGGEHTPCITVLIGFRYNATALKQFTCFGKMKEGPWLLLGALALCVQLTAAHGGISDDHPVIEDALVSVMLAKGRTEADEYQLECCRSRDCCCQHLHLLQQIDRSISRGIVIVLNLPAFQ
jgi:hypothetical protein